MENSKQPYIPQPDKIINKLASLFHASLVEARYSIWTTEWLNEFIELQATSFIYAFDIEKNSMRSVFHVFKSKTKQSNVFLTPDESVIENYVSELQQSIIIKPLLTKSPLVKIDHITYPSLEKILVDLYCDQKIFFAYQGHQLVKIYETSLEKYFINFPRLFAYAKRRNREGKIRQFLMENKYLSQEVKDLIR